MSAASFVLPSLLALLAFGANGAPGSGPQDTPPGDPQQDEPQQDEPQQDDPPRDEPPAEQGQPDDATQAPPSRDAPTAGGAQGDESEGSGPAPVETPPRAVGAEESLAEFAERVTAAAGVGVQARDLDGAAPLLTLQTGEATAERPVFVLCGDVRSHREAFERLALGAGEDVARLRDSIVVHFLALDVAVLDGEDEGAVAFPADFPVGWVPAPLRPDTGEAPLARADARALADLLRNEPRVVALVLGTDDVPWLEDGPVDPRALEPNFPRGRPRDYAWYALGIPSLSLQPAPDDPLTALRWGPRLALDVDEVAALGDGQWRVDVTLRNDGRLPTFTPPAQQLRAVEGLTLRVAGARVVAAAAATAPDAPHAVVLGRAVGDEWQLPLGPLAGGEEVGLRLVVQASEGAQPVVTAHSAWTASVRRGVALVP